MHVNQIEVGLLEPTVSILFTCNSILVVSFLVVLFLAIVEMGWPLFQWNFSINQSPLFLLVCYGLNWGLFTRYELMSSFLLVLFLWCWKLSNFITFLDLNSSKWYMWMNVNSKPILGLWIHFIHVCKQIVFNCLQDPKDFWVV